MEILNIAKIFVLSFSVLLSSQIECQELLWGSPGSSKEHLELSIEYWKKGDSDYPPEREYESIASMYWFLDMPDSSYFYLDKAYNANPQYTCWTSLWMGNLDKLEGHPLAKSAKNWFVSRFPIDKQNEFFSKCKECCDLSVENVIEYWIENGRMSPEEKDTLNYNALDSVFLKIESDDQKYRGPDTCYNREIQNSLDEENRKTIDNLYDDEFFESINSKSSSTLRLVLLHSTDCMWNQKWIMRILEDRQRRNVSGSRFRRLIEREMGCRRISQGCLYRYPNETKEFILTLNKKFSTNFLEKNGLGILIID